MTMERPERDRTDLGLSILPEPVAVHRCREGWLGTEDAPVPCPRCRPHLIHRSEGWSVTRNQSQTDTKETP